MKATLKKIEAIKAIQAKGIDLSKDVLEQSESNICEVRELAKGVKFTPSKFSYFGKSGQIYLHLQKIARKENLI